jgi:DASH complex subunit DAD3
LQLVIKTRALSETPDEAMLKRLRILERKMGLVLTLVRNDTRWLMLIFLHD